MFNKVANCSLSSRLTVSCSILALAKMTLKHLTSSNLLVYRLNISILLNIKDKVEWYKELVDGLLFGTVVETVRQMLTRFSIIVNLSGALCD